MGEIIKVGMADLKIALYPDSLKTLGLGSCVGIALYDNSTKISGMAHVMLPSSENCRDTANKFKFADTAIPILLNEMIKSGANRGRIVAKLAGGAQMFTGYITNEVIKIGPRNIEATKISLRELNIPIVGEDLGGNYGRTIELFSESGILVISSLGKHVKEM
jgi:chemotaxis protein CheD